MNYKYVRQFGGSDKRDNIIMRIDDDGSVTCIPSDPRNRDWQDYQAWLANGNVPLAQDPMPSDS